MMILGPPDTKKQVKNKSNHHEKRPHPRLHRLQVQVLHLNLSGGGGQQRGPHWRHERKFNGKLEVLPPALV